MSIRVENEVAYVSTMAEAFEAADLSNVNDVVIEDNAERIKMNKLIKAMGRL